MPTQGEQLKLEPVFAVDLEGRLAEPAHQYEQLHLFDANKPHRIWKIPLAHFFTAIRIQDFSHRYTGNTRLGTRIVNAIDTALGYNRFYNPSPKEYSAEDICSVLEYAESHPHNRRQFNLGAISMALFQMFCADIKVELDKQ